MSGSLSSRHLSPLQFVRVLPDPPFSGLSAILERAIAQLLMLKLLSSSSTRTMAAASKPAQRLQHVLSTLATPAASPELLGTLRIGDLSHPIYVSTDPERLPRSEHLLQLTDPTSAAHLHWLLQKVLLGQDTFLFGPPGPYARRLALTYCSMVVSCRHSVGGKGGELTAKFTRRTNRSRSLASTATLERASSSRAGRFAREGSSSTSTRRRFVPSSEGASSSSTGLSDVSGVYSLSSTTCWRIVRWCGVLVGRSERS